MSRYSFCAALRCGWPPLLLATLLASAGPPAWAADPFHFSATPLKAADCVANPSASFFTQNIELAEPPHPTLEIDRYYFMVRYLGACRT